MNIYFIAAGVLAIIVGLVHSVLGEVMIFNRMRRGNIIPTNGGELLAESNVRILWASWHVLSVFGWALAALLIWLALASPPPATTTVIANIVSMSMLAGSALVLIGTRGKHPGWIGLLCVAVLVWLGSSGMA